jgi:hypothetical protein
MLGRVLPSGCDSTPDWLIKELIVRSANQTPQRFCWTATSSTVLFADALALGNASPRGTSEPRRAIAHGTRLFYVTALYFQAAN